MSTENGFAKLAAIDVSKHVEKKQNLSYLSWSCAIDQLMRHDPSANWEFHEPKMYGETMMVSCTVTAFGKPVTMHLPVMNHRNQAEKNPDAFVVNKNMMRCLVKAIACHGLGLYIYAGEDLPLDEEGEQQRQPAQKPQAQQHAPRPLDVQAACKAISEAKSLGNAKGFRDNALSRAENDEQRNMINAAFNDYEQAALASA